MARELIHTPGRRGGTKDILDGVETTWARVPGGDEVAKLADVAVAKFDFKDPAASVPGLLAIRKRLAALPLDSIVSRKKQQLDRAIQGCLGLVVETTVPQAEVVPGEVLHLRHSAKVARSCASAGCRCRTRWRAGRSIQPIDLDGRTPAIRDLEQAACRPPLEPPLLAGDDHPVGIFTIDSGTLIGRPEYSGGFPGRAPVPDRRPDAGGRRPAIQAAQQGQPARPLDVIAPSALRHLSEVRLFAPGAETKGGSRGRSPADSRRAHWN